MKYSLCGKEFERAELNIWGKRFCPYCSYDLSLEE
jgi:DNA-directed RNA polymerase subunit RPC12/RpoP